MHRIALLCLVGLVGAGISGCATFPLDPFEFTRSLSESQRKYTQYVRWGEFELASRFVDADLRADYLAKLEPFEASIRLGDYEIRQIDYDDEKLNADVDVTYEGYHLSSLVVKTVHESQKWSRDTGSKTWWLTPDTEGLLTELEGLKAN